jgi:tRNA(fMet)-specific endonuclease VapC
MLLLDTNILTAMYVGNSKILTALDRSEDPDVATTIINKVELLKGRMDFLLKAESGVEVLRAQAWFQETERLLEEIPVVTFDSRSAELFDELSQRSALRKIGRADLLIGTIPVPGGCANALVNRATIVTRNLKDFQRIPGLKLVNWMD